MGVPLNLKDIQSGFLTASAFNENNTLTEEALAKALNRTSNATDNAMEVNLDMGLNKIFNLEDGFLGHEATNLSQVKRLIQNASSGLIARLRETRKTATEGQTVFNLADITYTPGANSIMVYVNGVAQVAGIDYQETDSTTITFFSGLNAGDAVDVYVNESTTNVSDTVLREQLGSEASGQGASLVSMEGGPTVQEVIENLQIVNMSDFGVVADGDGTAGVGTDNTAALQAINAYLSGKSNVKVICPSGWVRFVADKTAPIFDISTSSGIVFDLAGTNFKDDQSYSGGESADFWKFSASSDCSVSHGEVKSQAYVVGVGNDGLNVVNVAPGCARITHSGYVNGGLGGTIATTTDPVNDTKSYGIKSFLKCVGVEYPFNLRDSGNQSLCYIDCENAGRPFFVYGVDTVKGYVKTKAQGKSSGITSYNARVSRNIDLTYIDVDTTAYPVTADELIELGVNGSGAGLDGIKLNINAKFGTNSIGHFIGLSKSDSGTGSSADLGVFFRNISISGSFDFNGQSGNVIQPVAGLFHANETVENFSIQKVSVRNRVSGNLSFTIFNDAIIKNFELREVSGIRSAFADFPITAYKVFCDEELSTTDAAQTYIDCTIGNGGGFQNTENKTFIRTSVGGSAVFDKTLNFGEGATFVLSGKGNVLVTAGVGQTFDTGIATSTTRVQQVIVSFKRSGTARVDTGAYLYNNAGAAGSDIQVLIAGSGNSAGLTNTVLSTSVDGTLEVTADFANDGLLYVSVVG